MGSDGGANKKAGAGAGLFAKSVTTPQASVLTFST